MLLPIDMKPEYSLYFYGAIIISKLKEKSCVDIIDLYFTIKQTEKISLISYSLALDWLYMIESVYVDEQGRVNLCTLKD